MPLGSIAVGTSPICCGHSYPLRFPRPPCASCAATPPVPPRFHSPLSRPFRSPQRLLPTFPDLPVAAIRLRSTAIEAPPIHRRRSSRRLSLPSQFSPTPPFPRHQLLSAPNPSCAAIHLLARRSHSPPVTSPAASPAPSAHIEAEPLQPIHSPRCRFLARRLQCCRSSPFKLPYARPAKRFLCGRSSLIHSSLLDPVAASPLLRPRVPACRRQCGRSFALASPPTLSPPMQPTLSTAGISKRSISNAAPRVPSCLSPAIPVLCCFSCPLRSFRSTSFPLLPLLSPRGPTNTIASPAAVPLQRARVPAYPTRSSAADPVQRAPLVSGPDRPCPLLHAPLHCRQTAPTHAGRLLPYPLKCSRSISSPALTSRLLCRRSISLRSLLAQSFAANPLVRSPDRTNPMRPTRTLAHHPARILCRLSTAFVSFPARTFPLRPILPSPLLSPLHHSYAADPSQSSRPACLSIPLQPVRSIAVAPNPTRSIAAIPPQRRAAVEAVRHYAVGYFLRGFFVVVFSAFSAASTCGTATCAHVYFL